MRDNHVLITVFSNVETATIFLRSNIIRILCLRIMNKIFVLQFILSYSEKFNKVVPFNMFKCILCKKSIYTKIEYTYPHASTYILNLHIEKVFYFKLSSQSVINLKISN